MTLSRQWQRVSLALLAGVLLPEGDVSAAPAPLCLRIDAQQSAGLPLYLAAYRADAGSWDAEPDLLLRKVLPEQASTRIDLPLPPGAYAFRAFVDLNADEELNLNQRGHPVEPYASSQHPDRRRRSLRFAHAILDMTTDAPCAPLELTYPRQPQITAPPAQAQP